MSAPVMTCEDPQWHEFRSRLSYYVVRFGCESIEWPYASAVLREMQYNVKESLDYFAARGGHCDCEILLNVDRDPDDLEDFVDEDAPPPGMSPTDREQWAADDTWEDWP